MVRITLIETQPLSNWGLRGHGLDRYIRDGEGCLVSAFLWSPSYSQQKAVVLKGKLNSNSDEFAPWTKLFPVSRLFQGGLSSAKLPEQQFQIIEDELIPFDKRLGN